MSYIKYQMIKICSKCKISKEISEFFKNKTQKDGLQSYCKICHSEAVYKNKDKKLAYIKTWMENNPEKVSLTRYIGKLRRKYNLTWEEYQNKLISQGNVCKICGSNDPKRGTKYFCVDHNHITNQIRGLLCQDCNDAIGRFNEDILILNNVIYYLDNSVIDIYNINETEFTLEVGNLACWKHTLKTKFGITPGQYLTILNDQQRKCKICKSEEPGRKRTVFSIDHNHKTGKIRGLLCGACNEGLGKFYDNPMFVSFAIKYLEEYASG